MQETWSWSLGQEIPQSRKGQPTPVFLPGKSHWQRSLVGHSTWGCKESDTIYQLKNNKTKNSKLSCLELFGWHFIVLPCVNKNHLCPGFLHPSQMLSWIMKGFYGLFLISTALFAPNRPWTVACQAPFYPGKNMGAGQLPFPTPGVTVNSAGARASLPSSNSCSAT